MIGRGGSQSGGPDRRCCFFWLCWRLASSRRRLDARLGLVRIRRAGGDAASSNMRRSFSRQSATLRPASRNRSLVTSKSPPAVTRRPYFASSRARTAAGNVGLCRTAQRSNALLLTLLTFCPPGPELRANVNSNSRKRNLEIGSDDEHYVRAVAAEAGQAHVVALAAAADEQLDVVEDPPAERADAVGVAAELRQQPLRAVEFVRRRSWPR